MHGTLRLIAPVVLAAALGLGSAFAQDDFDPANLSELIFSSWQNRCDRAGGESVPPCYAEKDARTGSGRFIVSAVILGRESCSSWRQPASMVMGLW